MKNYLRSILFGLLCLNLTAHAQMGPGGGPHFGGAMDKLFGDNKSFSATLDMQMADPAGGETMEIPFAFAFDSGKTRFEMNMSEMKGHNMSPEAAAHLKAMGMDKSVTISLPADNTTYLIYPDMQAYVEMSVPNTEPATNDVKIEITKLGEGTVDHHPCMENKVVITDKEGNQHAFTAWNATDLNKFPVKIVQNEEDHQVTMLFKNIKLSKPDASLFKVPAGFTKYDNMQTMMRDQMMKKMGGMGMPPSQ